MQNKTLLTAMLIFSLLFFEKIYSQGITWRLAGNINVTATSFLGSTNNAALSFRTFNTQFMYISNFVMGSPPGAVAIGQNFSTPLSLLHINSNGQSVVTGETFRTTSNATGTNFNAWRMFTGTGAGTEKFSLYVPASSNNVVFQATQTTGELRFNTAGLGGRRFRIFSNGNVGVGDYNLFTPQSILHLHSQPAVPNGTKTYMQITDGGSGVTATDGFKIGTSNAVAEVRQQEDADMIFYTGNNNSANPPVLHQTHMVIKGQTGVTQGFVSIGTGFTNPQSLLHLHNNTAPTTTVEQATYEQFTVDGANGTGNTAGDGFKVGVRSFWNGTAFESIAELKQQENAPMNFFTNNTQRATILANGNVGINTDAPGNHLEINTPATTLSSTASGLKFSDVNNTVTPPANNTTGVLSLDNLGNVIWVADAGGGGGGGTGTVTTGQNGLSNLNPSTLELGGSLLQDTDIPLAGNKLTFSGTTGNVGIGLTSPTARFHVQGAGSTDATFSIKAQNSSSILTFSVDDGQVTWSKYLRVGDTPYNTNGAIRLHVKSSRALATIQSTGSVSNSVLEVVSDNGTALALAQNNSAFTIDGLLTPNLAHLQAYTNAGLLIYNHHPSGHISFATGGYAASNERMRIDATGNVGIGIAAISPYKLTINGQTFSTVDGVYMSDAAIKQNIDSIPNALSIISQLQPHTYTFDTATYNYMNLPAGKQYGLIGQEAETVLPEIVTNNDYPAQKDTLGNILVPQTTYKGLNYTALIPILIQGMKEQQQTINSQQSAIDSLQAAISNNPQSIMDSIHSAQIATIQNCINNLPAGMGCDGSSAKMANPVNNNGSANIVQHDVILKGEIILDQNNPNPFKESTTITYFIPEYIHFAQIIFSDNTGRIINTVDIDHTGQGQLNVKAEKLGSGMYSYSIIVDGKVIDTKKMIKMN